HRRHRAAEPGALRLLPLHPGRRGDAGDLAEHARRLLHGHPGQADVLADLGARRRGRLHRRRAALADHPGAFQPRLPRDQGLPGGGARRLRQHSRRARRRRHHRRRRVALGLLPARRLQGCRRLRRAAGGPALATPGAVRQQCHQEGVKAMNVHVNTSYARADRLFASRNATFWYLVLGLVLLGAPWFLESYYLSQAVFVLIYAIVDIAMNVLSGQAGQISIGHAAFFAIGAYTGAVAANNGVPLPVYLLGAGALAGLVGYL